MIKTIKLKKIIHMMNKQLLNVIMLALGFALATNPYTNSMNPGLVPFFL
jgi:hypothetical protein